MNTYTPVLQEIVDGDRLHLESTIEHFGILELNISTDRKRFLKVVFDSHLAYRKVEEGDALLTISEIRNSVGTGKYIYLVNDSDFVNWIILQKFDTFRKGSLFHYMFALSDDIIDVISLEEPKILSFR